METVTNVRDLASKAGQEAALLGWVAKLRSSGKIAFVELRDGTGTGLGLSIVRQILHAHNEQIHVESTIGRGTRFWFDLPLAEEEIKEHED